MIGNFILAGVLLVLSNYCVQETNSQKPAGPIKVCYVPNWAVYRKGPSGPFSADDIDFTYCNVIVYGYFGINDANYTLRLTDPYSDLPKDKGGFHGFIGKVVERAKAAKVPVLAGFAGTDESANASYVKLFEDQTLHEKFAKDAVTFLTGFGFQGMSLDYEYPQCPKQKCSSGTSVKLGYSKLIVALSTEFKKSKFLLAAEVWADGDKIDTSFEPKVLETNVDWIVVNAWDYHTSKDKTLGLMAPMIQYGSDPPTLNVKASVEAWLAKGMSPGKVLLAVALNGVKYKLADKTKHTIGSPAIPTELTEYSSYDNICNGVKSGNYTVVTEENGKPFGGTYAYNNDTWIGYDDIPDVQVKGKYIQEKKLGGYLAYALQMEDFKNTCGKGKYPLLSALSKSVG